MKGSMMLEEKRHPNVKVLYYNTHNDALRQIQDLQTCAAQNPSAIIVWPHSIKPLTPVIDGAGCGVFTWRPPGRLVRALSDVLDRGVTV